MQNTRDEIDSTDVGQGVADIGELSFLRNGIEHLGCDKVRDGTQCQKKVGCHRRAKIPDRFGNLL